MDVDDYYMNHVFLSELWLWKHMLDNIDVNVSDRWKKQLSDEKRHAAMTKGALRKSLKFKGLSLELINNNTQFSLEKALYQDLGGIDVDAISDKDFSPFVYVVERRASLLFKYYLKFGSNEYYKKVTKKIIQDETDHLDIHRSLAEKNPYYETFNLIDRKIYARLSEVYSGGTTPFFNKIEFWHDMFNYNLKDKVGVIR